MEATLTRAKVSAAEIARRVVRRPIWADRFLLYDGREFRAYFEPYRRFCPESTPWIRSMLYHEIQKAGRVPTRRLVADCMWHLQQQVFCPMEPFSFP